VRACKGAGPRCTPCWFPCLALLRVLKLNLLLRTCALCKHLHLHHLSILVHKMQQCPSTAHAVGAGAQVQVPSTGCTTACACTPSTAAQAGAKPMCTRKHACTRTATQTAMPMHTYAYLTCTQLKQADALTHTPACEPRAHACLGCSRGACQRLSTLGLHAQQVVLATCSVCASVRVRAPAAALHHHPPEVAAVSGGPAAAAGASACWVRAGGECMLECLLGRAKQEVSSARSACLPD